jgi:MOSC domain-containing protein YiiM
MWKGTVVSIHLTAAASAPMLAKQEVRAVVGKGLEGDRYFSQTGTYSHKPGPDREVTLIESEALAALQQEEGITLPAGDSRRNIVTRGVPLNHLVGKEFRVGEVILRGIRLCEPCAHLAQLTQQGVLRGLVHRGGLRAQILTNGSIRVGDSIYTSEAKG